MKLSLNLITSHLSMGKKERIKTIYKTKIFIKQKKKKEN